MIATVEGVLVKRSRRPGKTVALIGGVHGNERIGVDTVRWARKHVAPDTGTIYFIEGNPRAIEQGVRFTEKDLNACFFNSQGTALEERRARKLMPILAQCDATLDLHASNSKKATPFVICEENGMAFARLLNFPIITTGWDALDPFSTDAYMNKRGKVGVGVECGSIYFPEETTSLARETVLRFLQFNQIIRGPARSVEEVSRHIRVHSSVDQNEYPIIFSKDYADFELLAAGEVFAHAGTKEYRAAEGDCILFPRPNAPVGYDAFILGKEMDSQ